MSNVQLYCLGAMLADEVAGRGFEDVARSLEAALGTLLAHLSREEQGEALRLSYHLALASDEPALPRLRLVASRD